MHFRIDKKSDVQLQISRVEKYVRSFTQDLNFISETVTISSEIIYNIIKFSPDGEFSITGREGCIHISARDTGRGFLDRVEDAMKEGYTTAGSLGLGIPSIIRMSDEIEITTSHSGTSIECIKVLR